jgi:hypothetical protein
MKQMMKYTFAIVTMLLMSLGANANQVVKVNGTTVIDEQGNLDTYTAPKGQGTVSASIDNSRVVTLTITPAEGYFVMKDNITAVKTIDGSNAQTRTPGINTPLAITGDDVVIGPAAKTFTVTIPESRYDLEVTVDFQATIDITNATITLSETSYTYDGKEKKPGVSSVKLSGAELNATYYTVGYSNNTNAGTATVTVTGSGIYKNATSTTFTIEKAAAGLAYSKESVEVSNRAEWTQPTLTNPHKLTVTYASSKTDVATIDTDGKVSIVGAGKTTISAAFAGNDNYKAQTASYELTVKNADSGIEWTDERMDYVMGTYWWGPRLVNPNNLEVKYSSSKEKVATIDENTGEITVVGPGTCKIIATFEGNDQYAPKTVSYVLEVTEEYKLWVGSTQVTSENRNDILGDGHFFYDKENKWLVITSNTEPKVIESRMSDLTIYINGGSKLERIWFNNEGNADNTGKLYFTSYMNIPGSIDFSTSDASGVISGFSSIGLDEDAFLYLLDPTDGSYTGSKLVTKDGATAQVATIGQYLKPLANGSTVTFPSGKYDTEDLTNKVIDNILNTLIQHTGDSDEYDDYFDSAESAIILNNLNTTNGITLLMDNIEKGELIPGSEEYAVKFRGGLTFMVPDGEGTITLNVKTEAGYKLMLMIGQSEPKEIVQTEQGEVSFDYNVEKPTYCCLYLVQDAAASRGTRIGKRDKHHGSIQSVRVLAQKSSLNPLGKISGFPDSKTPEVEIGSEETTGIKEIKIDNTTNDPVNDDNRWFDMQGRQIEKPTKAGIDIQNRKKIVIR